MCEFDHDTIFVQVINFPRRKMIFKQIAHNCRFTDIPEMTCLTDWEALAAIKEALYEPVTLSWDQSKSDKYTDKPSVGVEVPLCYNGEVPTGFDITILPPCKMMIFQGNYSYKEGAIDFHKSIDKYNPEIYGFKWADEDAPRIRLTPRGYRGYIEARPVRLTSE